MKDDDWQALLKELRGVDVQLPLHQKVLKERLLTMHATRTARRRRLSKNEMQMLVASKRILSLGLAVVVAGILILGLLAILPTPHNMPAKKLIAKAKAIKPLKPAKIAKVLTVQSAGGTQGGDAPVASAAYNPSSSQQGQPAQTSGTGQTHPASVVQVVNAVQALPPVVVAVDVGGQPLLSVGNGSSAQQELRAAQKAVRQAAKEERKEAHAEAKALRKSGGLTGALGL